MGCVTISNGAIWHLLAKTRSTIGKRNKEFPDLFFEGEGEGNGDERL